MAMRPHLTGKYETFFLIKQYRLCRGDTTYTQTRAASYEYSVFVLCVSELMKKNRNRVQTNDRIVHMLGVLYGEFSWMLPTK